MNPRMAFVIDGSNGVVRYTMQPQQMKRVQLLPDDIVVVSDEFENVRPDVYYDLKSKTLKLHDRPKVERKPNPIVDRIEAYPNFGDQLDAIFKGFVAIRDSDITLPDATLEWISKIESIKTRFPKLPE